MGKKNSRFSRVLYIWGKGEEIHRDDTHSTKSPVNNNVKKKAMIFFSSLSSISFSHTDIPLAKEKTWLGTFAVSEIDFGVPRPEAANQANQDPQIRPHGLRRGRFPRHLKRPSTRPRPLARPIGKLCCLFGTDPSESRQVQIRVPFRKAPKRARVMDTRNHAFFRAGEGHRTSTKARTAPGWGDIIFVPRSHTF
ncbi:hypothetical protein SEUBUCD646_0B06190 [Saccharomyces eubayanus]|uniref:Uncharacterized protein n=1 Tax=Saccharomyces eubayanus TaxID=1080349 RepID=A0ABN8VRN4_SACEU|nr:hypothetical protein SEUBUCD650_0B06190 [Saccharomyces eubayanus]CAI1899689.1 hypothetical protein SEUBUCD646_0B06190 [Saccharomyces eubayanus]